MGADATAERTSREPLTAVESDQESSMYARSKLPQALISPINHDNLDYSDDTSESNVENCPNEPSGSAALSIINREIIKKYFSETKPIYLPQTHPTIALNQNQIGHILRIVAVESARVSYEMMDCILRRASEINLSSANATNATGKPARTGLDSELSNAETEVVSTRTVGTRYGEASEAYRTDDESNSIGYTYEYPPSTSSVVQINQPPVPARLSLVPWTLDGTLTNSIARFVRVIFPFMDKDRVKYSSNMPLNAI